MSGSRSLKRASAADGSASARSKTPYCLLHACTHPYGIPHYLLHRCTHRYGIPYCLLHRCTRLYGIP
jgi:hypothetical protein